MNSDTHQVGDSHPVFSRQMCNVSLEHYMDLYDNYNPFVPLNKDESKVISFTTDHLVLICVCNGTALVEVNDSEVQLKKRSYLAIHSHSKVRLLDFSQDFSCYHYSVHSSLVHDIFVDLGLNYDSSRMTYDYRIKEMDEEEFDSRKRLYETVRQVLQRADVSNRRALARIFGNIEFIYNLEFFEQAVRSNKESTSRQNLMFKKFVDLLNQYGTEQREVQFYARQLGITPKYLSALCMTYSGKNASNWIDDFVVTKAKQMMREERCPIYVISERLNFSSQSFFGRYFKRVTGMSPRAFLKSLPKNSL